MGATGGMKTIRSSDGLHNAVRKFICHALSSSRGMVLARFYEEETGKEYGLNRKAKADLIRKFRNNTRVIPSATSWLYHVVLATEIFRIPPSVRGDVVECGCWKGGSTANLSLICKKIERKLVVCDSFEGLPEDDNRATHEYPHIRVYGYYRKGMYSARMEEVKENIFLYGDPSVCRFIPGFFSASLKSLSDPVAFAFLDVDLVTSMRDCIKFIWPLLIDGGMIYTDDSCDMEVVRVWFDDEWWRREIGCRAPGYVGSGCGLPIDTDFSSLGYARKVSDPTRSYKHVPWLHYPEDGMDGDLPSMSDSR